MNNPTILVTGATGKTGAATIDELLKRGVGVRAYLRSESDHAKELRARGVQVALGDYTDLDQIKVAMEGIRSAYFLYPIAPGIIGAAAFFAQAATESEIESIVNMSQISARRHAKSHAAQDHWVSERVFDWSGIPTTHLRPTFFADWLVYPTFSKDILETGKIGFPFGEGRHAPISAEDQGRVIATILVNPEGHGGKSYDLCGAVEMDQHQIAKVMSRTLGIDIEYAPVTLEEFKNQLEIKYKFPPFFVQHIIEVAKDYQTNKVFSGANDLVEQITGIRALTLEEFLEKNRAAYKLP